MGSQRKTPEKSPEEKRKLEIFKNNYFRFKAELEKFLGLRLIAEDIANASGLKVDSIRQYEGGKRRAEADSLEMLARVFGRPMEDFGKPDPPPVDPRRMRRWFAAPKTVGRPPPGMIEELDAVIQKYEHRELVDRTRIKDGLRDGKKR